MNPLSLQRIIAAREIGSCPEVHGSPACEGCRYRNICQAPPYVIRESEDIPDGLDSWSRYSSYIGRKRDIGEMIGAIGAMAPKNHL